MSNIDVDSILDLSCLAITDERKKEFSGQLQKILDYMSVLNNVDQLPDPQFEWPISKDVVTREDVPKLFEHPLVEQNAPDFKSGGFSVPRII
ncbi:MAG: Asp-tRNA(Asn)/Glu-tRNA(Gln) amidotransferase subunit GatC [Candidatus Margulisiibacteriota bacterium]